MFGPLNLMNFYHVIILVIAGLSFMVVYFLAIDTSLKKLQKNNDTLALNPELGPEVADKQPSERELAATSEEGVGLRYYYLEDLVDNTEKDFLQSPNNEKPKTKMAPKTKRPQKSKTKKRPKNKGALRKNKKKKKE
jgi:hypothetical protein